MVANIKTERPTRPVLRYHGGKFLLGKWIASHFPPHKVYTEAYGGAASVLLFKPRSYAEVYNDADGEICNLFRVLRDPVQAREMKRVLILTPFARAEFEQSYLTAGDPIEQARRTVARSFMGFGSAAASGQDTGFRNDSNRSGSTPAQDWKNYPNALDFFVERLRGVVIENRDALKVLKKFDTPDALHYVDPPYVRSMRSQKRRTSDCYRFEMSDEQHAEMVRVLHELKGMIVLSGYSSEMYEAEFSGWHRYERPSLADGARPRVEVLWLNEAAHSGVKVAQQGLF